MKRWQKITLVCAAVLATLLAGAYLSLGWMVERVVERFGPRITQTDVRLAYAGVLPFAGRGTLRGLEVANPKGYSDSAALRLGKLRVHLDGGSLFKDPVVVRSLEIDAPEVLLEGTPAANNLTRIRTNVAESRSRSGAPSRRFIIHELVIRDSKVDYRTKNSDNALLSLDVPTVRLRDLGVEQGGIRADQLVDVVLDRWIGDVRGVVVHGLAAVGKGKELIDTGVKTGKDVGKALKDIVD